MTQRQEGSTIGIRTLIESIGTIDLIHLRQRPKNYHLLRPDDPEMQSKLKKSPHHWGQ